MSVARVYLPTDRKYKSVKTSSVLKFDPEAFDSDDEAQKKKLYQLKEGKKKGVSCQVLRIRATLKQLAESIGAKRLHVPKLTASQIKAGWQSDSDGDSMTTAKKTRKVEKHVKKQASKATSQDIVEAYRTKGKLGKQVEKVQSVQKVQKVEESGISSNILTEYKDSNGSGGSQNDEFSSSDESTVGQLQRKLRKIQKAYNEMAQELEQQKHELKTVTTKYEQLKTSKSYPLTEKTGREILAVLNNRWEVMPNSTCDEKFKDPQTEPKIGTLKGEETYIGKGAWISTISYEALLREKESSKFVSGLSRSIWGVKPLSERCVRKQSNTQVNELSPKKKAAVGNFFEIWMRDKRKYPEDLVADELKKLNKYLNGAITSARSTITPKRKKSHPKDAPNTLPLCSGHSEDESKIDKENNSRKKEKKTIKTTIGEQTKSFTFVAIDQRKKLDNVLKEGLKADTKNDENINNLETDRIEIMDKDSTNSIQEELSEIGSITSIEKDQDLILSNDDLGNDDFVEPAVEEDE